MEWGQATPSGVRLIWRFPGPSAERGQIWARFAQLRRCLTHVSVWPKLGPVRPDSALLRATLDIRRDLRNNLGSVRPHVGVSSPKLRFVRPHLALFGPNVWLELARLRLGSTDFVPTLLALVDQTPVRLGRSSARFGSAAPGAMWPTLLDSVERGLSSTTHLTHWTTPGSLWQSIGLGFARLRGSI